MRFLLEIWSGSLGGDSKLCIFECPMYVLVNNKLERRVNECFFVDFDSGVVRFRTWNLVASKFLILHVKSSAERVHKQVELVGDNSKEVEHNLDVSDMTDIASSTEAPVQKKKTNKQVETTIVFGRGVRYGFEETGAYGFSAAYTWYVLEAVFMEVMSCVSAKGLVAIDNRTCELCRPPPKMELVSRKWVYKFGKDYDEVISPVVIHTFIHDLLSIEAVIDLRLEHVYVKDVILHWELEEEIYVCQPNGFVVEVEDHIGLLRSLDDLKQSTRRKYKRFDTFIVTHGFARSEWDGCGYLKGCSGDSLVLAFVDGMLVAAEEINGVNLVKFVAKFKWFLDLVGVVKH